MTHTSSLLLRVRSRIATASAVEDLQRGLAAGSATVLAALAADRIGWLVADSQVALGVGLGVATIVPLVGLIVRRTDSRTAAAIADERLGLRERLSTSLWCAAGARSGEPLGALVVEDAETAAAKVRPADVHRAIRPRLLRRPLIAAGVGVAACGALLLWQPAAQALETPDQKAARLAAEDRVAEVARKLAEQAKKVEEAAKERKEETLATAAASIRKAAVEMQRQPPAQQAALSKLNQMADRATEAARRMAGMKDPADAEAMSLQEKALSELLKDLADAKIESLSRDVRDLEQRLKDDPKGSGAPSMEDIRALAARVDALRRAVERAKEAGAKDLERALRNLGNEDLLEKIAQRMRELAAKMEKGDGYKDLEGSDGEGEEMDLGDLTREELEQLLKDLMEMQALEELGQACREGGAEARGGKKLKFRPGQKSGGT